MKRKFAVVMAFLTLLFVLIPGLATNAQAATVQIGTQTSFSAMQKTCSVINAYLHGTQPSTITCTQERTISAAPPKTHVADCNSGGNPSMTAVAVVAGTADLVCFFGQGYLGYRINNVAQVISAAQLNGWILYYIPGSTKGTYYNINKYNNWEVDFISQHMDITQIDPGAQQGGNASELIP